jgi:5'-nucleotidase
VLKVTGKAIFGALENGVSNYPALEGRFPQVSNITFEVDYSKTPQSRIQNVTVGGEPLDEKREYVLATRGYMGRGKGMLRRTSHAVFLPLQRLIDPRWLHIPSH